MQVGGQRQASAAFPAGKTRYPLYRRLSGPQGRSGRGRKMSPACMYSMKMCVPSSVFIVACTRQVDDLKPFTIWQLLFIGSVPFEILRLSATNFCTHLVSGCGLCVGRHSVTDYERYVRVSPAGQRHTSLKVITGWGGGDGGD
jgi:hypothetical protein